MLIVSVDIGTRNFAYTVYCTDKRSFVVFQILDLRKVKDPVLRMKELSDSEYFDKAEVILVENQMRSCMKTMATALRCFHLDKVVKVHPHSVKRFFQTRLSALPAHQASILISFRNSHRVVTYTAWMRKKESSN